jgi:hypothetical protein
MLKTSISIRPAVFRNRLHGHRKLRKRLKRARIAPKQALLQGVFLDSIKSLCYSDALTLSYYQSTGMEKSSEKEVINGTILLDP